MSDDRKQKRWPADAIGLKFQAKEFARQHPGRILYPPCLGCRGARDLASSSLCERCRSTVREVVEAQPLIEVTP